MHLFARACGILGGQLHVHGPSMMALLCGVCTVAAFLCTEAETEAISKGTLEFSEVRADHLCNHVDTVKHSGVTYSKGGADGGATGGGGGADGRGDVSGSAGGRGGGSSGGVVGGENGGGMEGGRQVASLSSPPQGTARLRACARPSP